MVGGEIVSIERLAPGTNLERTFLNTIDCHRSDGWIIENDPNYPCVFAHKSRERRMVTLYHIDPAGMPFVADPLGAKERLANLLSDNVLPRLVPELEVLPWVLRKAPEPLGPIRQLGSDQTQPH